MKNSKKKIQKINSDPDPPSPLKSPEIYGWQLKALEILDNQKVNREVLWLWSDKAPIGKSSLSVWFLDNKNAICWQGQTIKRTRSVCELFTNAEYIIVDIPKCRKNKFDIDLISRLKDGYLISINKKPYRFNPPKVLILSQFPPDKKVLSEDQWVIYKIDDLVNE